MAGKHKIDKVRASRDGHEFHEAWTARKSMQLLWPDSNLSALAIEGLSPEDQEDASGTTVEVADVTLYFGGGSTFDQADRTTFAQFKYSIADQEKGFRAANATKTVEKFADTYRDFKAKYGAQKVEEKLDFQLTTNQPVSEALVQALEAIATGKTCTGDVEKQAVQLKTACGFTGRALVAFARKLSILGRSGSLPRNKQELASLVVDWSAAGTDPVAAARLGGLKQLVRDKAGFAGTGRNLITRTDLLAALEISDPKDLLPCESALVDVGKVLEREQLSDALAHVANTTTPLLIHAAGGVGKTVLMNTLATRTSATHEVVFFDCFGGGAYRSPEDARHQPKRGLIHIANTLAFRGLCDPVLPDSPDLQFLLSTVRRRLVQAVATLARTTPGRQLVIFIDAIDNAEFAARQCSEDCFPIKLLESLDTDPIPGVYLILSCRTERKPKTYAKYDELLLKSFTKAETTSFLKARLKQLSHVEIDVAQARSAGNARVLSYLLSSGRELLAPSEISKEIELDDLIQQRITDALKAALERGGEEKEINAFVAGLAVLPPPVPLEEFATAHGLDVSAVESFASDLSPLLERTSHGLMFRDEPTETLVHKRYATSRDALHRVAANLLASQDTSVYAARSLPRLLQELDESEQLFSLAFDERIPSSITSSIGKRNVRYARLKAATLHAALKKDYDRLVQLLVELSTIAAVDQRGADYILDHPDLVAAALDVDAKRRLFEFRTSWPGTRHARLAILHTLSGELGEAHRHVHAAEEWINHFLRTRRDYSAPETGPDHPDIAAIPLFHMVEGRAIDAARYLERWKTWYAYELCNFIISSAFISQAIPRKPARQLGRFIDALTGIGPLTSALSFAPLSKEKRKRIVVKLTTLCKVTQKIDLREQHSRHQEDHLEHGLRKATAISIGLGFGKDALEISRLIRHTRAGIWNFRDAFNYQTVFSHVCQAALLAAAKQQSVHEKDVLPKELVAICSRIPKSVTGQSFRQSAKQKLSKVARLPRNDIVAGKQATGMSYDEQRSAEQFIENRLEPLLSITSAMSAVISASSRTVDRCFVALIEAWEQTRKNRNAYRSEDTDRLFSLIGLEAALFALATRTELREESVIRLLTGMHDHIAGANNSIRIVAILAQRPDLHVLAGEQAMRARALIESEDEVDYRASLYGELARAMLPASIEEASTYFHDGLEQLDAIGSGDYQFTNELLLLASQIKGNELAENDFHTLTNLCELNMGEEPEKFFWGAFGRGLAKTAGVRGLAKLSRWDDRNKIGLDNTLLPYLTGLLEAGKIDATEALALNRLANPVEYYFAGTKEFASALRERSGPEPVTILELIKQFEEDNPTWASDGTVDTLRALAEESLGTSHKTTCRMSSARKHYAIVRDTLNRRSSSDSESDSAHREVMAQRDEQNREELARIAAETNPLDMESLVKAIIAFNALENLYDLKAEFFAALRSKVPYSGRGDYVRNVAALESLYFYWKFAELQEAKSAWARSSATLARVFKEIAFPMVRAHADDLIDNGRLSGSSVKEISEFTGVSKAELVLEVIKIFARPDTTVDGSAWMAFASHIAPAAEAGQAQLALQRLLSSDAARLADSVNDGPLHPGGYPSNEVGEVAGGLIWRRLGSPRAVDRWRAAHALRSFAKFGRWDVVDCVVRHTAAIDAGAFQAPELTFFYLHARLWLLIALARMALDYPERVAHYKNELLAVVTEAQAPHVLMQCYAAKALLACHMAGKLSLPSKILRIVKKGPTSPFPRLLNKSRKGGDFYQGRAKNVDKPPFEFHLEHDFQKEDVDSLGHVFSIGCWEVADMISGIVQKLDPRASTMYELGGRESSSRNGNGASSEYDTYGHQLGWHGLFIAAGKLLATQPVTDAWWYDDPWNEWLGRYGLTRDDGLWLSDGTDATPLDTSVLLLESVTKGLELTGSRDQIQQIVGLEGGRVAEQLVIDGRWFSADNIRIRISSALAQSSEAYQLAHKLVEEDPMSVWIPVFQESEEEAHWGEKKAYTPWVVSPHSEARLDEHDPYGVSIANTRPFLASAYRALCNITKDDQFGRVWRNKLGNEVLRAEAWGRNSDTRDRGATSGMRLLCGGVELKKILVAENKDLLILINLQRYEKNYQDSGTYTHSVAVIRIDRSLDVEYFAGLTNHLYKSRW
ncbi:ATP-binding protein [Pseudomonas sp. TNT2022 ID1044]|uniref:ATP-binding protein n=1 Tax=Pseudomonas sp. TNT2022 ID1044 TaxID=2942636 RepID=UPI00235F5E0A|nr:ATP-binding protein [Pseudomonas sp. TNT2022 ID1044]MDD0995868.1 ATP-binding protein [Pseudomonas sp. TNT2022 ID1044]